MTLLSAVIFFLCVGKKIFKKVYLHSYKLVAISGQMKFTRKHFRLLNITQPTTALILCHLF